MNFLLDTCTISDLFKKIPSVIAHFEEILPNQIQISTVSVMEIEYGLKLNKEREKKIRPLWDLLIETVEIIPFCEGCAKSTSLIRSNLKILGSSIGSFDCLLAGTALSHNLIVVTSNVGEFSRIPQITVEDWRQERL